MEEWPHWASKERRIYIRPIQEKNLEPFLKAALKFMLRERGGYPDQYDKLPFRWVIAISDEPSSSRIWDGLVYVSGYSRSSNTSSFNICFDIRGLPTHCFVKPGEAMVIPIRASQPFNWTVLEPEDFERLMFRMFFEMNDEYDNVQWLQMINDTDSGRDLSAYRKSNGNRVLIQARHQKKSIAAPEVNNVVVKAETWHPAFDEVFFVTTTGFTQEAIRWVENHNLKAQGRPKVTMLPKGHLEVMLTRLPYLISHLGLR